MSTFEQLIMGGTPPARGQVLALETKAGEVIRNAQALPPCSLSIDTYKRQLADNTNWQERKKERGVYNCAGHVWATRRTAIEDNETFWQILREDEYVEIPSSEALVGDLVTYHWRSDEIMHVGSVCRLDSVGNLRVPYVLSKVGDYGGEVIHHIGLWTAHEKYRVWRDT
jgi:hypothetical protein